MSLQVPARWASCSLSYDAFLPQSPAGFLLPCPLLCMGVGCQAVTVLPHLEMLITNTLPLPFHSQTHGSKYGCYAYVIFAALSVSHSDFLRLVYMEENSDDLQCQVFALKQLLDAIHDNSEYHLLEWVCGCYRGSDLLFQVKC